MDRPAPGSYVNKYSFSAVFFGGGGASSRHRALVGEVTSICTAFFGS